MDDPERKADLEAEVERAWQRLYQELENVPNEHIVEVVEKLGLGQQLYKNRFEDIGRKAYDRYYHEAQQQEFRRMHDEAAILPEAPTETKVRKADIRDYADNDSQTKAQRAVHHDSDAGMAVATNGNILLADRQSFEKSKAGKSFDAKTGEEVDTRLILRNEDGTVRFDRPWLDWRRVTQRETRAVAEMDHAEIEKAAKDIRKGLALLKKGERANATVSVRFPDGSVMMYSAEKLAMFFEGMLKIGATKIEMSKASEIIARSDNGVVMLSTGIKYRADYKLEIKGKNPASSASGSDISPERGAGPVTASEPDVRYRFAEDEFEIVDVPMHDFKGDDIKKEAYEWIRENLKDPVHMTDSSGRDIPTFVSNNGGKKIVDSSSINKSSGQDVHYSVIKKLPEILENSIEGEVHHDRKEKQAENETLILVQVRIF